MIPILEFIISPIGRIIAVGVVSFGLGVGVRGRIDHSIELRRDNAALAERLKTVEREASASKARLADEENLSKTLQERIDAYVATVDKHPSRACGATDADVRSLRGIH